VFAPPNVTVLPVVLFTAPSPARTPVTMPACMSNVVVADTVAPACRKPPVSW
jgi:hypothetical protein